MDQTVDLSGTSIDKYSIKRKIGNGSFGAVYHVIDMALQSEKAIKILDVSQPEKALAMLKEAEIPFKCRHKNIVTINEANIFPVQGSLKVVIDMELVNGGSFEASQRGQYMPIVDGLKLLSDALYGLEYAHINGIIHRDIKPANILIHNGIPKISDFGLAVPSGTEVEPWIWYRTHAAPEVFSDSIATASSDIFAFGMTLYRAVNNIANWRDFLGNIKDASVLMRNGKLIDKLPFNPVVPNKVRQIIKKACKLNPTDRFQTAAELRDAMDKLKYKCRWQPIDDAVWEGAMYKEGDTISVLVNRTKTKNEFIAKKNGRTISAETKRFDTEDEAIKYMYNFIARNTIY